VILDGTDNLRTRYLLNEWSIANGIPWIYGAVMFAQGIPKKISLPSNRLCRASQNYR
jgi:molybdopterin-synthase adenylyltransferase